MYLPGEESEIIGRRVKLPLYREILSSPNRIGASKTNACCRARLRRKLYISIGKQNKKMLCVLCSRMVRLAMFMRLLLEIWKTEVFN